MKVPAVKLVVQAAGAHDAYEVGGEDDAEHGVYPHALTCISGCLQNPAGMLSQFCILDRTKASLQYQENSRDC